MEMCFKLIKKTFSSDIYRTLILLSVIQNASATICRVINFGYRLHVPDQDGAGGVGRRERQSVGDVLERRRSVPPDLRHRRAMLVQTLKNKASRF